MDTTEERQAAIAAGAELRARREAAGLSIRDLAGRVGVSASRYRAWEVRFGVLPRRQFARAIAQAIGLDPGWLAVLPGPQPFERRPLGQRAAKRRRALGMRLAYIGDLLGVTGEAVRQWEGYLPAGLPADLWAAWEKALRVPAGWLLDSAMETPEVTSGAIGALAPGEEFRLDAEVPSCAQDEILAVSAWLVRRHGRTAQFDQLKESEQRWALIFADRYGVSGPGFSTLQSVGDKYGLTRERVRQIIERMASRAPEILSRFPCLSAIKEAVESGAPVSVAAFEAQHRALLGELLSLADADRFAREILGFPLANITKGQHFSRPNALQAMIGGDDGRRLAAAVRDASRRMIRSCGAAHVLYVTGMASEMMECAVSVADVRSALPAIAGMAWLTDDKDWYWLGPDVRDNRVLTAVLKVLRVAQRRTDIEDLHQAVCRSRRSLIEEDRRVPPPIEIPKHVLQAVLSRIPWLKVTQSNDFELGDGAPDADELAPIERSAVDLLSRHGWVVSRNTLYRALVDSGQYSLPAIQPLLASSPIFRLLGAGLYALRGADFSVEAMQAALASIPANSVTAVRAPSAPDADGWVEFSFNVTEAAIRGRSVAWPVQITRAIPTGRYQASGCVNGVIRVGYPGSPTTVTGLGRLLRIGGIKPGRVLRVRTHVKKFVAEFSVAP